MSNDKDYVLGTHDDEIARLGLQHKVWRARALDAWLRAGFTQGHTIIDLGCGPGYASLDLAEVVGSSGQVIAIDRSLRFLKFLESRCAQRELTNISIHEIDLNDDAFPEILADGAWARWVFAFAKNPKGLLKRVSLALKPGGTFVIQEYFDYSTWRMTPRCVELEEFVEIVMKSWRDEGGEPDIGLELPAWLREFGFELKSLCPVIYIVPPLNFIWQWPEAFLRVGLQRMAALDYITEQRAAEIEQAFVLRESDSGSLIITPAVLEIIAVKRM